jgi:uncharacterized protein
METRKDPENEWFARNESELIRQARREREMRQKASLQGEAEARRALHFMKCPKCGSDLHSERIHDVAVDRCASCGGTFFDRGELETLLLSEHGKRRGFFRRLLGVD